MMQNPTIASLTLSVLISASWACGSSSAPDTTDSGGNAATFSEVYSKVIVTYKCQTCHIPTGIGVKDGHLDMSTQALAYTNLVGVKAMGTGCGTSGKTRVIPGDAADSLIVEKTEVKTDMSKPPCGSEMPINCGPASHLPCLGPNDLAPLVSWINAGAKND
jgi:hypothetical protein